jgi:hypothetical protein
MSVWGFWICLTGWIVVAAVGLWRQRKRSPPIKRTTELQRIIGLLVAISSFFLGVTVFSLWQPKGISDVPLASLTLGGIAVDLLWWLVLFAFVLVTIGGLGLLFQNSPPEPFRPQPPFHGQWPPYKP